MLNASGSLVKVACFSTLFSKQVVEEWIIREHVAEQAARLAAFLADCQENGQFQTQRVIAGLHGAERGGPGHDNVRLAINLLLRLGRFVVERVQGERVAAERGRPVDLGLHTATEIRLDLHGHKFTYVQSAFRHQQTQGRLLPVAGHGLIVVRSGDIRRRQRRGRLDARVTEQVPETCKTMGRVVSALLPLPNFIAGIINFPARVAVTR